MAGSKKIQVAYVTSSQYKEEENRVFMDVCALADGTPVKEVFEFTIRRVPIPEMLEVDIAVMVQAEVVEAYGQIRIPCIVEHAGLIFEDYRNLSYPGGLTKPMWNTLGDKFIAETNSANRRVIARAVVAYCDGQHVKTFIGETKGVIADQPRGQRQFYWDTVFVPDEPSGGPGNMTYAQIVADPKLGLSYKMKELSQSAKALLKFLEYRRISAPGSLWQ